MIAQFGQYSTARYLTAVLLFSLVVFMMVYCGVLVKQIKKNRGLQQQIAQAVQRVAANDNPEQPKDQVAQNLPSHVVAARVQHVLFVLSKHAQSWALQPKKSKQRKKNEYVLWQVKSAVRYQDVLLLIQALNDEQVKVLRLQDNLDNGPWLSMTLEVSLV